MSNSLAKLPRWPGTGRAHSAGSRTWGKRIGSGPWKCLPLFVSAPHFNMYSPHLQPLLAAGTFPPGTSSQETDDSLSAIFCHGNVIYFFLQLCYADRRYVDWIKGLEAPYETFFTKAAFPAAGSGAGLLAGAACRGLGRPWARISPPRTPCSTRRRNSPPTFSGVPPIPICGRKTWSRIPPMRMSRPL